MKLYYALVVRPYVRLLRNSATPTNPSQSAFVFAIAGWVCAVGWPMVIMLAISTGLLRLAIVDPGTIKRKLGMSR